MSTLAEIEAAIETLPAAQVEELAAWIDRRRETHALDEMRSAPPEPTERKSVRDFFGCFSSGDPRSGDNERIDAELARELNKELGAE